MNNVIVGSSIEEGLAEYADTITGLLKTIIPSKKGAEGRLYDAMRYAVLGRGKYIRPYILRASSRIFDVEESLYLRAGAAVEMVHAYSLVHDDLPAMDDDDVRRGRPSCHIAFDEATAILAGDALLTLAFEVIADAKTHPSPDVRNRLILDLAVRAGASGMVGGQMIDLESEHTEVSAAFIAHLATMKTGALISYATAAGAILGDAGDHVISIMETFGFELGLAFQIVDDLLDVEGDEGDVGKKIGKDDGAGKATLISVLGLEGAKHEARKVTDRALSRLDALGSRADELRKLSEFVLSRKS